MRNTITVRIPAEMQNELKKICRAEDVDLSEIVRAALKRVIALHKFKRLRRGTIPFAERAGILADEDILSFRS